MGSQDSGYKSNLELIKECNEFPYYEDSPEYYNNYLTNFHEFKVDGCNAVLGYIPNAVVEKFPWSEAHWNVNGLTQTVALMTPKDVAYQGGACAVRSTLMAQYLDVARKNGTFLILKGWNNEVCPVYGPGGELLLEMERCACPLFGIVTYGVHMTAYIEDEEGLRLWVPRRSPTKKTYPGMLDNTVAGGMSSGELPYECVAREAMEEASLPEDVVKNNSTPAGCLSYIYVRDSRAGGETGLLQPGIGYTYDIKLDASIMPKTNDSEVERFHLWNVDQVKEALRNGEFHPGCSMVIIDFFMRRGILTAENEPDYLEIAARLHRRLMFPTASHAGQMMGPKAQL